MEKQQTKKQGSFTRLLGYIVRHYPVYTAVVAVCILVSALASSIATIFLQKLIDECITPGLVTGLSSVWGTLLSLITMMGCVYLLGVAAAWLYTRLVAVITQGKKDFERFNDQLFGDSEKANIYGNILMPILGNIGNLMYVVLAIFGSFFGVDWRHQRKPDRRQPVNHRQYCVVFIHVPPAVPNRVAGVHAGQHGCHGHCGCGARVCAD